MGADENLLATRQLRVNQQRARQGAAILRLPESGAEPRIIRNSLLDAYVDCLHFLEQVGVMPEMLRGIEEEAFRLFRVEYERTDPKRLDAAGAVAEGGSPPGAPPEASEEGR